MEKTSSLLVLAILISVFLVGVQTIDNSEDIFGYDSAGSHFSSCQALKFEVAEILSQLPRGMLENMLINPLLRGVDIAKACLNCFLAATSIPFSLTFDSLVVFQESCEEIVTSTVNLFSTAPIIYFAKSSYYLSTSFYSIYETCGPSNFWSGYSLPPAPLKSKRRVSCDEAAVYIDEAFHQKTDGLYEKEVLREMDEVFSNMMDLYHRTLQPSRILSNTESAIQIVQKISADSKNIKENFIDQALAPLGFFIEGLETSCNSKSTQRITTDTEEENCSMLVNYIHIQAQTIMGSVPSWFKDWVTVMMNAFQTCVVHSVNDLCIQSRKEVFEFQETHEVKSEDVYEAFEETFLLVIDLFKTTKACGYSTHLEQEKKVFYSLPPCHQTMLKALSEFQNVFFAFVNIDQVQFQEVHLKDLSGVFQGVLDHCQTSGPEEPLKEECSLALVEVSPKIKELVMFSESVLKRMSRFLELIGLIGSKCQNN